MVVLFLAESDAGGADSLVEVVLIKKRVTRFNDGFMTYWFKIPSFGVRFHTFLNQIFMGS